MNWLPLGRHGDLMPVLSGRVRRLSTDGPSLESVLSSLTGRELRDQPADDGSEAFGRRGGEHTT
jgi:hypothetical protein